MTCAVCRVEKILAGTFPVASQDSTVDAVDTRVDTRVDRSLLGINIFLASAESHPVLTSQIFNMPKNIFRSCQMPELYGLNFFAFNIHIISI